MITEVQFGTSAFLFAVSLQLIRPQILDHIKQSSLTNRQRQIGGETIQNELPVKRLNINVVLCYEILYKYLCAPLCFYFG